MSATDEKAESERCDRCGQPAVAKVGDEYLCESCYQNPGSCCMEFGGDDLWAFEQEDERKRKNGG